MIHSSLIHSFYSKPLPQFVVGSKLDDTPTPGTVLSVFIKP